MHRGGRIDLGARRRASVSVAASILRKAGWIDYARGHVTVLDRAGLEKAAGECYEVIMRQLQNWRKESH